MIIKKIFRIYELIFFSSNTFKRIEVDNYVAFMPLKKLFIDQGIAI